MGSAVALVPALPSRESSRLPNTQSQQRAAIIEWRTQLELLAGAVGVHLPADLQQAGRGEIAPALSDIVLTALPRAISRSHAGRPDPRRRGALEMSAGPPGVARAASAEAVGTRRQSDRPAHP
jgi:hypothetical protein